MTRLFLGPSHRVSFARSLSGVSASAAFGRTLPTPICSPFDLSDYSAVFRLRPLKTDPLLGLILSGATHVPWVLPRPSTRRVVTFPLHLTIGHRIAGSGWDTISRQTVWAACTTAFFSSARLGELLSYPAHAHDPSADRYGEMFSSTLLPLSSFSSSHQNLRLRLASFSPCLRSRGTTVALSSPSRLSGASILRPA